MSEKQPQSPELHWRGGGRPRGPAWLITTVVLDCIWNARIIYCKIQLQIRKVQFFLSHNVESRQAFYESFFLSNLVRKAVLFHESVKFMRRVKNVCPEMFRNKHHFLISVIVKNLFYCTHLKWFLKNMNSHLPHVSGIGRYSRIILKLFMFCTLTCIGGGAG